RYLNNLRLEAAALRLVETTEDIQQIARSSGFGSLQHFSNAFKGHYGMAPTKYRAEKIGY
ncbi:MAG: helix-turn-helix domain-containing protein, partial [Chitinivibrionales bacterium]|nr:helix-turn-helix domain-containing protein [Chitinivibrionales bacterium]